MHAFTIKHAWKNRKLMILAPCATMYVQCAANMPLHAAV